MKLTYPTMRSELISHLEDLADQRKIATGGPTGSLLNYAIHFLFDDTVLAEDAKRAIGWFLLDEGEADAIQAVTKALNQIFDVYGTEMSDRDYANCPEWHTVIKSSKAALATLIEANDRYSSEVSQKK